MTKPNKDQPSRRISKRLEKQRQSQRMPLPLQNKKPPRKTAVSTEDSINQPMMEGQRKRKVIDIEVPEESIEAPTEKKISSNNEEVGEKKSEEKEEETSKEVQEEKKKQANEMNIADNEVVVEEAPPVASIPTTQKEESPSTNEAVSPDSSLKKRKVLSKEEQAVQKVYDASENIFTYQVVWDQWEDVYEDFKNMQVTQWNTNQVFIRTFAELSVMSEEEVESQANNKYRWIYRFEEDVGANEKTTIPVNARTLFDNIQDKSWYVEGAELVLQLKKPSTTKGGKGTYHDWIEIRKSGSKNKPYGVFALRTFTLRTPVSLFVGKKKDITTGEPIDKKVQMACNVVLPNKERELRVATINNVDETAPKYPLYLGSHYINNRDDVAKIYDNKAKQNVQIGKNGILVASRKIQVGEELLLGSTHRNFKAEAEKLNNLELKMSAST